MLIEPTIFKLKAQRAALGMEVLGMKHSRNVSVYANIKKEFGFKGSKQKVFDQLDEYVNNYMENNNE